MAIWRPYFRLAIVFVWIIALFTAFAADRPVATWVRDTMPVDKRVHRTHLVLETLKLPGWGPATFVIVVALGLYDRRHWQAAVALAVSAVGVGLAYSIIKWIVGRHRPVINVDPFSLHPFAGGLRGIWEEKALCFPSGHASLAFATAACLAILIPRWRWIFFAIAAATGVERVLENAHYCSDVVAGMGMGLLIGSIVTRAVLRRGIYDVTFSWGRPREFKE